MATFLQDSWKVTRKLTVDYGIRWDYGTYGREHGRAADFSPSVVNSSAGGHLGSTIFEATCNCTFADNYPYAIGERLGVRYRIAPMTVLRAGWGVVYGFTADVAGKRRDLGDQWHECAGRIHQHLVAGRAAAAKVARL